MPLCARSISSMKPYHAVLHIVFVFSTSHIYFYPDTRFISSFIWGSFIYNFYLCVYIYMNVIFVCIFYSVTGHHGRTVWLNGPPCINIFEINKIKDIKHRMWIYCKLILIRVVCLWISWNEIIYIYRFVGLTFAGWHAHGICWLQWACLHNRTRCLWVEILGVWDAPLSC